MSGKETVLAVYFLTVITAIYTKVLQVMGSKAINIAWDRLMCPASDGGFGLYNLEEMNLRFSRKWVLYIRNNPINIFSKVVIEWDTQSLFNASKFFPNIRVGPLISANNFWDYAPFWNGLAHACEGKLIEFYTPGSYHKKDNDDTLGIQVNIISFDTTEIVMVSDVQHYYLPHKVYPADCDCVEALKRADSITIDGYKVADLSKKWLPIKKVSLRLTPAQQRRFTLTQFLKTLSNINKSAMKDYTKQWALQALHTKLATRYRTDRCHWCDVIIGYDHFFADCVFLYVFGNVWGDREDEMNQCLTGHL